MTGLNGAFDSLHEGDCLRFGRWPQGENGEIRELEWLVLDRTPDRILVISRVGLVCREYSEQFYTARRPREPGRTCWENSALREWLNGEFLAAAFSPEEQARIPQVLIPAEWNPRYSAWAREALTGRPVENWEWEATSPGPDTRDRIFLLSISEAQRLFPSDRDRRCGLAAHALPGCWEDALRTVDSAPCCRWWLRTIGAYSAFAALVDFDGSISRRGSFIWSGVTAVRPAMWIAREETPGACKEEPENGEGESCG